jgi:hypothetical protein
MSASLIPSNLPRRTGNFEWPEERTICVWCCPAACGNNYLTCGIPTATHRTEGWENHTAGPKVLEKRKISCPYRDSKAESSSPDPGCCTPCNNGSDVPTGKKNQLGTRINKEPIVKPAYNGTGRFNAGTRDCNSFPLNTGFRYAQVPLKTGFIHCIWSAQHTCTVATLHYVSPTLLVVRPRDMETRVWASLIATHVA